MKTKKFTLRLPQEIAEGIAKVAKISDRSINGAIVHACRKLIDDCGIEIGEEQAK